MASRPARAVVVGAGLAGLSAALHLAGAGRQVTVLERADAVGGLAARCEVTGASGAAYRLDCGPTVLTMPEILDDCFAAVGERRADRLALTRLDPAYRAHFADGTSLDLTSDPTTMARRIGELAGPAEADGYRRWVDWVTRLHDAEFEPFIAAQMGSPAAMLTPALAKVVALGGFSSLAARIERFFSDPRLQRCFSFQALYAGLAPQQARAIYAVIGYLDLVAGVWYPQGGMAAVPEAMAAAARASGVEIVTGVEVTGVRRAAGRVTGVVAAQGDWPCDELVVTLDAPAALRLLGRHSRRVATRRHSPSCVVLAAGLTPQWRTAPQVHHSMHFGTAWHEVFDDLLGGRLMRDPSWLLSMPSATDPGAAPDGGHAAYLLFPTPNLDTMPSWERDRAAYAEHVVRTVERRYPGFADALDASRWLTPTEWAAQGLAAGTPFAAAHTVAQTGPFRTSNQVEPGVVLAGASTTPGVGVPMVLLSGRLAAQRLCAAEAGGRP
ncbi:MAG TPA: phytoene desaturase family protein [Dermatophilaceae bacterium]|nr:phytoene desaturase family protein [Dermatophilaceae bacterium]